MALCPTVFDSLKSLWSLSFQHPPLQQQPQECFHQMFCNPPPPSQPIALEQMSHQSSQWIKEYQMYCNGNNPNDDWTRRHLRKCNGLWRWEISFHDKDIGSLLRKIHMNWDRRNRGGEALQLVKTHLSYVHIFYGTLPLSHTSLTAIGPCGNFVEISQILLKESLSSWRFKIR